MSKSNIKPSTAFAHPLDPLTQEEIKGTVQAVRDYIQSGAHVGKPVEKPLFNVIALREPGKFAILQWAKLVPEEELAAVGGKREPLKRQADALFICPVSKQSFEAIIDLPSNIGGAGPEKPTVSSWTPLHEVLQPALQAEELLWMEEICRKDPKVKEACEAVGIKQEDVFVDGWCIALDERFPGRRLQQGFCFARSRADDNLYAHPLDFIPVMDSHTGEILVIDYPYGNNAPGEEFPPSSAAQQALKPQRPRMHPPKANHNYLPEQIKKDEPDFKLREGLKPLHVIQPEGVSYKIEGRVISWQNWKMHIGFTHREGLVLSNITYDDGKKGTRPIFYRLSVAEMVVPYSKTVFPHHRKHAFDTGEYGIGALSNSLALGCDCLGSITYLDADFVSANGGIQQIKSAVCIHEEDAGILHKHTDFRDNRAHVARNRKLIISSIATVANYEYGFYFTFGLDGAIELEVKATGIVNVWGLRPGEARDPGHEVVVAPQIAAQHHQHLFSLRVDPIVDGVQNRVVEVDVVSDEAAVGSAENFYGNGFHTEKKPFKTSKEAVSDADASKVRSWVIENPNKQHYSSGGNVGYKISSKDMPPLLAKPGSLVWNRAPFARHNMFVTTYQEEELFPSDVHINQNPGGEDFGIATWVNRNDNIDNKDIVVWPTFGVTHIARPEEWPIMPVEILRVHMKPVGFFDRNPGLDIPSSADIKSRYANEALSNGLSGVHISESNGNSTANGSCCSGR